ncbi:autotransporter outer membrane beta-barrel domain-containing protein [Segnochrobactrum spirostomi]|nr:autotransporter domain-containing protein [Segnochrobactrum spirostomi]
MCPIGTPLAHAAGGAGGGEGSSGGAGGGDSLTGVGTAGAVGTGSQGAGGGGGAGVTGGSGATGANGYATFGAGGAAGGGTGGNGGFGNGGGAGGGGGGGHGYVGAAAPTGAVRGGNGGYGGSDGGSNGGGGGAGGYGAVLTGRAYDLGYSIVGGTGGNGGYGNWGGTGYGGAGGTGGIGLAFTATDGVVAVVRTTIQGGTGGEGGSGAPVPPGGTPGADGAGGVGIAGQNLTLVLTSTAVVSGGLTWDGSVRSAAIAFTGGANVLELQPGASIVGAVTGAGANDVLRLGGPGSASFALGSLNTGSQFAGFGVVEKTGASVWTLDGSTTATPEWKVKEGVLALESGIGLAGIVRVERNGTLDLTGANTSSGPVILDGTLVSESLANAGVGSNAVIGGVDLRAGAVIETVGPSTLVMSGPLVGDGPLVKNGAGTLTLSAVNAYTGATQINNGTLALIGAASIARSSGVTIAGGAVLDISAANAGTAITSLAGSGTVALGTETLAITNGAGTFSGTIEGTGKLLVTGGSQSLGGDQTYSGETVVAGGVLYVDGSLANSAVLVGNGGTIGGNGVLASLDVAPGGKVAPGHSPGTLTITGDLALAPGATYAADIVSTGQSDLLAVGGSAQIGGSTLAINAAQGIYLPGMTYTLLTATGGIDGRFGSVTTNFSSVFLDTDVVYGPDSLSVAIARNDTSFPSIAVTPNQAAVAAAIEAARAGQSTSDLYNAVLQLSASQAQAAFDATSGEVYATTATILQQEAIYLRDAVQGRVRQGLAAQSVTTDETASAGPQTAALAAGYDATLWTQGFGGWGQTAGDGNAASASSTIAGFFTGVDARVAESYRVGLVAGYSRSTIDVDARASGVDTDNYDVGLYGGAKFGALDLVAAATYTWHDNAVNRTIAFPFYNGTANADYTSGTTQVFGEASYRIDLPTALGGKPMLAPFADLAYVNYSGGDFTESGSSAALTGSVESQNTVYSTLGARAAMAFELANGAHLAPYLNLGWQHAYGDVDGQASMAFTGASGSGFATWGVPIARDSAIVGGGISYAFSRNVDASLSYDGQFASGIETNAFRGALNIRF